MQLDFSSGKLIRKIIEAKIALVKICSQTVKPLQTRGQRRWKANWPDFILKYCRQEVRISSTVFSSFWYQKFCQAYVNFLLEIVFKVNPFQNFLFSYSVSNIWLNWRNFPAKKLRRIRMRRFFFKKIFRIVYFQVACLFFNKCQ